MDRKYNLRLDLQFRCNNSVLKFRQSDNKTSDFFMRITSGGELFNIDNAIVILAAIKPNKDTQCQFLEVKEGKIYADLNSNMKDQVGIYKAQALLIYEDERVSTDVIEYEVTEDNILNQLETTVSTTEEFTMLQQMLSRLSVVENSEETRKLAELSREEAEKQREENAKKAIEELNNITKNFDTTVFEKVDAKVDEIIDPTLNEKLPSIVSNKIESIKGELKGDKGEKGDKGDKGDIGPRGETGPAGPQGERGIQGEIGQKGETGTTGPKGEKGERGEQGLPGNDGRDGITPNIQIGTVTTLEPNQQATVTRRGTDTEPILDFGIPRGENGSDGGNANIDDTQVSTDTTWSSDKISTWSMEQDGVFWTKKEDNFISADDTYEYKLREVEIFGDTWQDSDSKNLVLFDASLFNDSDISKITVEKEGTISFTNSNLVSTKDIQLSPNTEYTIHAIQTTVSGDAPCNLIRIYENNSQIAAVVSSKNYTKFTTSDTGVIKISFFTKLGTWTNEITKYSDLMIFKGADNIKYEPYHKADLSNIQHAGELYVDEEGQPILDSEGREQYKIEIEVCNANLWDVSKMKIPENWDGVWKTNLNTSNFNLRYDETYYFDVGTRVFFKKNSSKVLEVATNTKQFATIPNYDEVSFDAYIPDMTLEQYKEKLKNGYITTGKKALPVVIPHSSHKQTILLPCQLMKVGDVKDRLFWDESKGRYVVEKKLFKKNLSNLEWVLQTMTSVDDKQITIYRTQIENSSTTIRNDRINLLSNSKVADWNTILKSVTQNTLALLNNNQLRVQFEGNAEECKLWANDKVIYYELDSYELIETNITTPIAIPTYNNKTHVYVVNGNNAKASIKAKFPLKTASAVATLNIENDKNSKDINKLQDSNVDIIATAWDTDFRVCELEWTLEELTGTQKINLLSERGINTMALSRFEQAKIIILGDAYYRPTFEKQLATYLKRGYLTQEEYDILIAMMDARETIEGE